MILENIFMPSSTFLFIKTLLINRIFPYRVYSLS